MRKILVTGGAGFIGSNFVHYIYQERPDWHITVYDKLTYAGNKANLAGLDEKRVAFIQADICDEAAINKAISEVDAVVHFAAEEKAKIIKALEEGLEESGYKVNKTYGQTIEDRDSQITLSILGQEIVAELGEEGLRIKEAWDPDGSKKLRIREIIAPKIPDFEVRAAGATSIDVTKPGVDKAYGMNKLMQARNLQKEDILFFGDKIIEGGNDFAVKKMGIDCIAVRSWEDTAYALEGIVKVI